MDPRQLTYLVVVALVIYALAWVIALSKLSLPVRLPIARSGKAGAFMISIVECPICLAGEIALVVGWLGWVSFPLIGKLPSSWGLSLFTISISLLMFNFTGGGGSASVHAGEAHE